jgi:hypothetical protein
VYLSTSLFMWLLLSVGPAHASCAHSQMPRTCEWEELIAVKEWRAQQLPQHEPARQISPPELELGLWTVGTEVPTQVHVCEVGGDEDDCFRVE